MYQPLPKFAPLFPPVDWWRLFLCWRLRGESEEGAVGKANSECGMKSREWMRFGCLSREGEPAIMPVSVDGGASALKNRPAESWTIAAEAEREEKKIASALATIYGRQPFFYLLKDALLPSLKAGDSAENICRQAFRNVVAVTSLDDETFLKQLGERLATGDSQLREISRELMGAWLGSGCGALSVVDPLFRFGPDAIFVMLTAF